MIATADLIKTIGANVQPVRRLQPPLVRACYWVLLGALILLVLAISQGLRPDLSERLRDPIFDMSMAGAVLTGISAAIAAFMLSLPDRSRFWLVLPAPALALWLSTVGYQCLTNWVEFEPGGMHMGETARCFATLVLTSFPLSLSMLLMLRYSAPLRPTTTTLTGSLAVAATAATALSLFHALDATVLLLTWNFGTAGLFLGLAGAFGNKLLSWAGPRPGVR